MNDSEWNELNDRLALAAKGQANWSILVAQEREVIDRAVRQINEKLRGHYIRPDYNQAQHYPNSWTRVELALVREDDGYGYPLTLTVSVDEVGRVDWERPWSENKPTITTFLTKGSTPSYESLIASMINANLDVRCV